MKLAYVDWIDISTTYVDFLHIFVHDKESIRGMLDYKSIGGFGLFKKKSHKRWRYR